MKLLKTLSLLGAMGALVSSLNAQTTNSIGVNFVGAHNGQATLIPTTPSPLNPTDLAGVHPQTNWNNIVGNSVTGQILKDQNGKITTVSLTFSTSESWGSTAVSVDEATAGTATPNEKLLQGYINSLDNATNTIFFNNVPAGTYRVLVYTVRDGAGRGAGYWVNDDFTNAFHINTDLGGAFDGTWIAGVNKDPDIGENGGRDVANYVQFDAIQPVGGRIKVEVRSEPFRGPIAAIQLLTTGVLPLSKATVESFAPSTVVAPSNAFVRLSLVDVGTKVNTNTIVLKIGTNTMTPTITKTGDVTTVNLATINASLLARGSNTVVLNFTDDGGTALTFTNNLVIDPFYDHYFIEAEHFNYDSGKYFDRPIDQMPAAYSNLVATLEVDYVDLNQGDAGARNYRAYESIVDSAMKNNNTTSRPGHGFEVTGDYAIGWVDGNEWFNYTRNFPSNEYRIYLYTASDAGAPDHKMGGELHLVTGNVTTANQTTNLLGIFRAEENDAWGPPYHAVLLADTNGVPVKVKLSGVQTLRYYTYRGDIDHFRFEPASQGTKVRPTVSTTPNNNATLYSLDGAKVEVKIGASDTTVNQGSIVLSYNGSTVTPSSVNKVGAVTTVQYTPSSFPLGSTNTVTIVFSDELGSITNTSSFIVSSGIGSIYIESEHFNFNSGQWTNPAPGVTWSDAYRDLSATIDVDYSDTLIVDAQNYRARVDNPGGQVQSAMVGSGSGKEVQMTLGRAIGTDYKIGWIDGGNWYNYTRNFPAGKYRVYLGVSHGDAPTVGDMGGQLAEVTGGATTATQTTVDLGAFRRPRNGGWGPPFFEAPLTNSTGVVELDLPAGLKTYRYTAFTGDIDYLRFEPQGTTPPPNTNTVSITKSANGTSVTITWKAGQVLQAKDTIEGIWTDVAGATGTSLTVPIDKTKNRFYRSRVQ